MDTYHDELLTRLNRLERAMNRADSHLTLLSQRNHSSHAQLGSGRTSIESNVDTTLNDYDPELDLTGIWTLRQTLHVAESVHSEYSTWEPDAESIRRVRLLDSESDQELSGDEPSRRPSTPQIESPQPSQAGITDVNARDSNGRTPLISAIRSRDESHLQAILGLNPDIHLRCTKGRTPLMHATEVEFEIAVRRLVDRGAEVNATTPGQSTALHQAASRGSTDMIELLISLDAIIECRNKDGATPLLKASEANQSATVSILLRKGADVSVKDNNGWGVLHYAVHSSAVDVLRVLFQNEGARIDLNSKCPAGKTALHFAAENASLEPAEILLDHGADIEARDFSMRERIPLHLAVSKAPTEQRIAFVKFLLSYRAYADMPQFSTQERRRYGHLLHRLSLARSDSGFSSLSPEVPVTRRQNSGNSNSDDSVVSPISRRIFPRRMR